MCGIIGLVNGNAVASKLVSGLKSLEYRGYDSSGIAVATDGQLFRRRAEGKLNNLTELLRESPVDGRAGIAHTRWATHGAPQSRNAHPHATDTVAVVHNGIIENFRELRRDLETEGCVFESDTDTEVIPHLITLYLAQGHSVEEALMRTMKRLRGSFALGVLVRNEEERLLAARRGSPLVIGSREGVGLIGSDAVALSPYVGEAIFLNDDEWAIITPQGCDVRDIEGAPVMRVPQKISGDTPIYGKGRYRHFMLKEIHEQPDVLRRSLARMEGPEPDSIKTGFFPEALRAADRLTIIGCGTSSYAGEIGKYWFERFARLPTDVDIASEFRYRHPVLSPKTGALLISQSGETADTLAAQRFVQAAGGATVAIVNNAHSSMAREAHAVLPILAGPEIGVASTKAFTAQISVLAALALIAGKERGTLSEADFTEHWRALKELPRTLERTLHARRDIADLGRKIANAKSALFIGRGTSYPVAKEGALKLKEISYIHAEGIGAGELKHGPIALVDSSMPVIVLAPRDESFEKTISNLQEVKARGGQIILVTDTSGANQVDDPTLSILSVPDADPFLSPFLFAAVLQLLAYYTAIEKGTDVDQPRNLAKSVTVE